MIFKEYYWFKEENVSKNCSQFFEEKKSHIKKHRIRNFGEKIPTQKNPNFHLKTDHEDINDVKKERNKKQENNQ